MGFSRGLESLGDPEDSQYLRVQPRCPHTSSQNPTSDLVADLFRLEIPLCLLSQLSPGSDPQVSLPFACQRTEYILSPRLSGTQTLPSVGN